MGLKLSNGGGKIGKFIPPFLEPRHGIGISEPRAGKRDSGRRIRPLFPPPGGRERNFLRVAP